METALEDAHDENQHTTGDSKLHDAYIAVPALMEDMKLPVTDSTNSSAENEPVIESNPHEPTDHERAMQVHMYCHVSSSPWF